MARRILVVDDEPQIRTVLRAYLEADGFEVIECGSGREALRQATASRGAPELVLLDVGLPDVDGLEVLRTIRQQSQLPVILVTARAEEVDKLVGLGVGADDYVTKPFSPREVVARVKTVLRRVRPDGPETVAQQDDPTLRFDGMVIDPERREVAVGDTTVALSTLELDLLIALASSPGRVFSRSQLLEKVWGYDFYGDERVVDVHIRSMRKALADDATSPRVIGTVRGVGYKFLLEPAEVGR
ncbi:MAG TPA: response regulator transcription factor [Humibacillus xanthopallidus]|nr:response regulator transcription factor [Humibacillus xanthopallidus]